MFGELSKQIIKGNAFLIICCVFYLLWWIIAFKPEGAVKGMRSGWLLIPAIVFGLMSIMLLIGAFRLSDGYETLFRSLWVLIAGAVIYIVLLFITSIFFHRIVTTELILIVGWTVLGICEINTLFALSAAGKASAWILIAITLVFSAVSMVCYMKYYELDAGKGWVCGMIPLILVMVMMLILTGVAFRAKT